jgi:hypothetical protein
MIYQTVGVALSYHTSNFNCPPLLGAGRGCGDGGAEEDRGGVGGGAAWCGAGRSWLGGDVFALRCICWRHRDSKAGQRCAREAKLKLQCVVGVSLRACLGEIQLWKNCFGVADPQISIVEQLHRGSEISENVWHSSGFLIIFMTARAHISAE